MNTNKLLLFDSFILTVIPLFKFSLVNLLIDGEIILLHSARDVRDLLSILNWYFIEKKKLLTCLQFSDDLELMAFKNPDYDLVSVRNEKVIEVNCIKIKVTTLYILLKLRNFRHDKKKSPT